MWLCVCVCVCVFCIHWNWTVILCASTHSRLLIQDCPKPKHTSSDPGPGQHAGPIPKHGHDGWRLSGLRPHRWHGWTVQSIPGNDGGQRRLARFRRHGHHGHAAASDNGWPVWRPVWHPGHEQCGWPGLCTYAALLCCQRWLGPTHGRPCSAWRVQRHMPFHAMSPGAKPGKQSMAGKRSASGGGGHGNGVQRKFATQCQTYAQIPVNFKMEVLQTIYPEVWNPVTSASKTMVDMDSCIAIGFDRWPGSPVETRSVTGLQCT